MSEPHANTPAWAPSFKQPIERVIARFKQYKADVGGFVVFENGTCVPVAPGLSEAAAVAAANAVFAEIVNKRPDLHPEPVNDGNVLIGFKPPAYNIVLSDFVLAHWAEIERRHSEWVLPDEVLMTPLGPNVFDDYGKKALLARTFMFMDARDPVPVHYQQG